MRGHADNPTASGQSRTELCLVAPFNEAAFGKHFLVRGLGRRIFLLNCKSGPLHPLGDKEGEPRADRLRLEDGLQFPQPGHPFSPLSLSNSTFSFSKESREPLKHRVVLGFHFLPHFSPPPCLVQCVMEILPQPLDEQTGSQQRAWQLAVARLGSAG